MPLTLKFCWLAWCKVAKAVLVAEFVSLVVDRWFARAGLARWIVGVNR